MPIYTKANDLKGKLFAGIKARDNYGPSVKDYSMLTDRAINTVLNPSMKTKIFHSKDGHNNRTGKKAIKSIARFTVGKVTSLIPIPVVGGLINAVVTKVDAVYRSDSLKKAAEKADLDTDAGMTAHLKAKLKLIDASELDRARSKVEEAYELCGVLEADLKNTSDQQVARCEQIKSAAQSVAYLIKRAQIFKRQANDMKSLAEIMDKHADNYQNKLDDVIDKMKSAAASSEALMSSDNHYYCKDGLCVLRSDFKIKDGAAQKPSWAKRYNPFAAKEITAAVSALVES
jgi:hypothetical protein